MCSFELLMMDGKNCLKHVQRLTEINKLRNVASCWLHSANGFGFWQGWEILSSWHCAWLCSPSNFIFMALCLALKPIQFYLHGTVPGSAAHPILSSWHCVWLWSPSNFCPVVTKILIPKDNVERACHWPLIAIWCQVMEKEALSPQTSGGSQ
jgi:hypothetical protein